MSTLGRSRPARPVANLYVTHPHLANTALTPRWHHPAFPFPSPWPLVPFPLAPWPFPLGPSALGLFPLDPCILPVRSKNRHREHYPLDQAEKSTTPPIKNVMFFRFSNIRYHYHYIHRQAEKLTTPTIKNVMFSMRPKFRRRYHFVVIARFPIPPCMRS